MNSVLNVSVLVLVLVDIANDSIGLTISLYSSFLLISYDTILYLYNS